MNDEFYMDLCLKEAWKFQILTYPNPAVGCAILDKNGALLSVKAHEKAGFLHAEPRAIFFALCKILPNFASHFMREYELEFGVKFSEISELENANLAPNFTYDFILLHHQNALQGAKAYVSLEPCAHKGKTPPCARLFVELGFASVCIGAHDENKIASGGARILKDAKIAVKMGVLADKISALMYPFYQWQSANFSFFKVAMTLNGKISGKISGPNSLSHMHQIRAIIDLLAIGGNTVRSDKPILDARFAPEILEILPKNEPKNSVQFRKNRAPDLFIYSNRHDFSADLPLYNVPNRSVEISDNFEQILSRKLCMIEGGANMLSALPNFVRYFLIYFSDDIYDKNSLNLGDNLSKNLRLKPLFLGENGGERYGWFEREI